MDTIKNGLQKIGPRDQGKLIFIVILNVQRTLTSVQYHSKHTANKLTAAGKVTDRQTDR